MYVLKKDGRKIKNATFDTYEKARQEARKRIRKDVQKVDLTQGELARIGWDSISRNPPSISDFGYSISRTS
jgi:hypothetical protein